MNHKAKIELETKNAEIILESIRPELKKNISERSKIQLKNEKHKLIINVLSKDINALKASINSMLQLIRAIQKNLKE